MPRGQYLRAYGRAMGSADTKQTMIPHDQGVPLTKIAQDTGDLILFASQSLKVMLAGFAMETPALA